MNIEGDDTDYEVTFSYIVDGEREEASDDCRSDFQPNSADVEFSTITKLDIEEDSEVLLKSNAKKMEIVTNHYSSQIQKMFL